MVSLTPPPPRRDLGRLLSRVLCAIFAVIGAIPLLAAFLVRSSPVQDWAARETARILREELGVTASYQVALELVPFRLTIRQLVVPGSDGKGPALTAEEIEVTPRVFSLIAGQLDAGDIEVERPKLRLVVKDGKLRNLSYRLAHEDEQRDASRRPPFASLAMTEASVDLSWDDRHLVSPEVDVDVLTEPGGAIEVALRLASASLTERRTRGAATPTWYEDALCRVDVRLSQREQHLTLRRLSVLAVADASPARHTLPGCPASVDAELPNRVTARVSSLRAAFDADGQPQSVGGHLVFSLPAMLANRFLDIEERFRGSLGFAGEFQYDEHSRLPQISGRAQGENLRVDDFVVASQFKTDIQVAGDEIRVSEFNMGFADGQATISGVKIKPLETGLPISAERVDTRGITFPGLMRDLDVTPNTIVRWDLDSALVEKLSGTLAPLDIGGELEAETSNFEVTDLAYHDPLRQRIVGVRRAAIRGQIRVDEQAFQLSNTRARFGNSSILVSQVSIGFDDDLKLVVPKGTTIDLKDIAPLVEIPMAGIAKIDGELGGEAPDVELRGEVAIEGFEFGGFPVGDILSASYRFVPLELDLSNVLAKKGQSPYRATSARLDFDTQATVKVDAWVESDSLDLRDFLAMWKFEKDPRWDHLKGHGKTQARIRYLIGGPEDRCGGGNLRVVGSGELDRLEGFGEHYDSGRADYDFHWTDFAAGYRGFSLDIASFNVTKGAGTMAGSLKMRPGATLDGKLVGSGIPLAKLDALGERVRAVDGRVISAVGEMTGTLDAVKMRANATISEITLGNHSLPPSDLTVRLEPVAKPIESRGTTRCGQPIPGDFDRQRWDADEVEGRFFVSGQLYGGQVAFSDLELTSQRAKVWSGRTELENLNLGAVLEFFAPGSQPDFKGKLSGSVEIAAYPMLDPASADLRLTARAFQANQAGLKATLASPSSVISVRQRNLTLENLALAITTPGGQSGVFDVRGSLEQLGAAPHVDAQLRLRPTDLSAFVSVIPTAEYAKGQVNATLEVQGPLANPNVRGGLNISDGEVQLEGLKSPVSDLNVDVIVDPTQIRVTEGTARVGNGRLRLEGRAPLQGTKLGTARADLQVQGLSLALEEGIRVTIDSKLKATYHPGDTSRVKPLPRVTGDVTVTSFDYTRPMSMTADLTTFARRGQRTQVDSYDPEADAVEFDIQLRSLRPLTIANELLDTELVVDSSGLRLKGTNQRFGMLGRLKLNPGGQIRLRNHEFEIRQGWVRFDDLNQIAPQVDVTAVTDYRRFEDVGASDPASTGAVSTGSVSSSSLGGQWRINLHAYGDPDNLKIDLTSTPNLPQDDIFLLLTVGLTRAELDQNRSAAVGSSVALEALGTLSGADRAVRDAVPVIDNASMGSAYNPKSGRTEPTITIGKRLAEKIRAQVTTGLSDSSKVESSLRWQMNPQVSVEGSYGNVNDISSSSLGNVGADVRWRLEFD